MAMTGYGKIYANGKLRLAHRVAWEFFRGSIPDDFVIDHRVCRMKCCVNPDHLVPCSCVEHTAQPDSGPQRNKAKTHCPRGHLYSGDNLYMASDNHRICVACRNAYIASTKGRKAVYAKKRRSEKKTELAAKNLAYRLLNRERLRALKKEKYWANRDSINALARIKYRAKITALSGGDEDA